jgi:hypothetical protein
MLFAPSHKAPVRRGRFLRIAGGFFVALVISTSVMGPFVQSVVAAGNVPPEVQAKVTEINNQFLQINPILSQLNSGQNVEANSAKVTAVLQKATDAKTQAETLINSIQNPEDKAAAQQALADSYYDRITSAAGRATTQQARIASGNNDQTALEKARQQNAQNTSINSAATGNTSDGKTTANHPLAICEVTNPNTYSMCIAGIFYVFFVDLTSPIAYLGGMVFDAFAGVSLDSTTYASGVIAKGWTIARDLANMAFVFILIYLAFLLILNSEGVGVARQIATIVAVALLINFSFFLSRAVIDVSNIFAHTFYDNIVAQKSPTSDSFTVSGLKVAGGQAAAVGFTTDIISISEKVMTGINPQALLSNTNFRQGIQNKDSSFINNLAVLLTLFFIFGVINIIMAFIFLTAAFQFLTRIVALWFAIILSPLAFISLIMPKGKGEHMWGEWTNLLIKNAFFAPAFLFVIFVIIKMLDGGLISGNIASFIGNAASQGTGVRSFLNLIVGVILRLAVVVGLFIAALKVGTYIGVQGGKGAQSLAGKIAIGGNARMLGWVGRNTAGAAGYMTSRASRNLASGTYGYEYGPDGKIIGKKAGFGGLMARTVGVGLGRAGEIGGGALAKASFDARASGIPGAKDGGTAQKGGYKKDLEDRSKHYEDLEHSRHDTPEEKALRTERERAIKQEINYEERKTAASRDLADAERYAATATRQLAEAANQARLAQELGGPADVAAAQELERQSRRFEAEAKTRVQERKGRLADLERSVTVAQGYKDADRKAAMVSELRSAGVHNFWGLASTATDRAAAKISTEKSKEAKLADAVRDMVGPPPPPPAPPAGGAPPAPGGGGGAHP